MPKQYKEDGIVFELIKTHTNIESARKESLRLRSHGFYSRVRHFYDNEGKVVGYGVLKSLKMRSSTKKSTPKKKPTKKKSPAKKPVKKKEIKIPKDVTSYWCDKCKTIHKRYDTKGRKISVFFEHYEYKKDLTSNQIFLEQMKKNWRSDVKREKEKKKKKKR